MRYCLSVNSIMVTLDNRAGLNVAMKHKENTLTIENRQVAKKVDNEIRTRVIVS